MSQNEPDQTLDPDWNKPRSGRLDIAKLQNSSSLHKFSPSTELQPDQEVICAYIPCEQPVVMGTPWCFEHRIEPDQALVAAWMESLGFHENMDSHGYGDPYWEKHVDGNNFLTITREQATFFYKAHIAAVAEGRREALLDIHHCRIRIDKDHSLIGKEVIPDLYVINNLSHLTPPKQEGKI